MRVFLQERFGSDLDFSQLGPEDWAVVSETWANLANAVDVPRKFCVVEQRRQLTYSVCACEPAND